MKAPKRPVYPVPFADAMRGLPTMYGSGIQACRDMAMRCLVRSYYGGWTRATLACIRAGLSSKWLSVHVEARLRWYRLRGLSEADVEARFR